MSLRRTTGYISLLPRYGLKSALRAFWVRLGSRLLQGEMHPMANRLSQGSIGPPRGMNHLEKWAFMGLIRRHSQGWVGSTALTDPINQGGR